MDVVLRNVKIKELMRILANLQMNYDVVDVVFDTLRNSMIINPVNMLPPSLPPSTETKEEQDDRIDPSATLNELLGE